MQTYYDLQNLPSFKNPVLTIGTFDGVHKGHQFVLQRLVNKAKEIDGESILITFEPHPRLVLQGNTTSIELLNTLEEKLVLLADLKLDYVIVVPFTKDFASMHADDYIKSFLVDNFHPHTIIIGYDHHFGQNRSGNYDLLNSKKNEFKYHLEEISPQEIENIVVSSTQIRDSLLTGQIEVSFEYLGYPYQLQGNVIHGVKRGRSIGFPTANIQVNDQYKLIPYTGVYAIKCLVDAIEYKGMMNIGTNPTVTDTLDLKLEVHLFEFDKDIYNQEITIRFLHRLRDEEKYDSLQDLIHQLQADARNALTYFASH